MAERLVGIDPGVHQHEVDRVAELGVNLTRLNFRIEDGFADFTDEQLVNGYRDTIQFYKERGIAIYALIGSESMAGGFDPQNMEGSIARYVDTVDLITDQFADYFADGTISGVELFNEGNNILGEGLPPVIPAENYAQLLNDVWQRIKVEKGKEATLNFGSILSHDLSGNVENDSGATYLQMVLQTGVEQYGWGIVTGYPFDNFTYHVYVAQDTSDTVVVRNHIQTNLDQINTVFTEYGIQTNMVISEMGWGTGEGGVDEAGQAQNIQTADETVRDNTNISAWIVFCMVDFDSRNYGVEGIDEDGNIVPKQAVATIKSFTAQQ